MMLDQRLHIQEMIENLKQEFSDPKIAQELSSTLRTKEDFTITVFADKQTKEAKSMCAKRTVPTGEFYHDTYLDGSAPMNQNQPLNDDFDPALIKDFLSTPNSRLYAQSYDYVDDYTPITKTNEQKSTTKTEDKEFTK